MCVCCNDADLQADEVQVPSRLPPSSAEWLPAIEADTFWCLSIVLESIQDNYTCNQPGIHSQLARLRLLVSRIDGTPHSLPSPLLLSSRYFTALCIMEQFITL